MEKEHKRFVNKVFQLDPNQKGVPWEAKAYSSKRKSSEATCSSESGETSSPSSQNQGGAKKRKKIVLNVLKNEEI